MVNEQISMGYWCNDTDRETPKHSDRILSHTTLSTTNLTWMGLESNPTSKGRVR